MRLVREKQQLALKSLAENGQGQGDGEAAAAAAEAAKTVKALAIIESTLEGRSAPMTAEERADAFKSVQLDDDGDESDGFEVITQPDGTQTRSPKKKSTAAAK